jgi:hypothetical protein
VIVRASRKAGLLVFYVVLATIVPFGRGHADCTVTNLGIPPLPDLVGNYKGYIGGLYPSGANRRPAAHEAAGRQIALENIQPRDTNGTVNATNGRIVLLSIGMSNTSQEWGGFKRDADRDSSKNPQLTVVNGAIGGNDATQWTNFLAPTWSLVTTQRLRAAGVTTNQVQVIWLKQALAGPNGYGAFPRHAQALQTNLEMIVRAAKRHYPNLAILYVSGRTRAYTTNANQLNPEPFAYESGFSVRWLIEKQLSGSPELNYDPGKGATVAPWLSWGPYIWADGTAGRSDGFMWLCSDVTSDFTHPSSEGVAKVVAQLLAFFKTDVTARPWFVRRTVVGQAPACAPSANVTSGAVPLTVSLTANASDDGIIREYLWTFEDGTFSTNANPIKTFNRPGVYRARVCVTDNDGNTAAGSVTINAGIASAQLSLPLYSETQFQFMVNGATNVDHIVQGSTDLVSWTSLHTNRPPFTFMGAADSRSRFYRVVAQ